MRHKVYPIAYPWKCMRTKRICDCNTYVILMCGIAALMLFFFFYSFAFQTVITELSNNILYVKVFHLMIEFFTR